VSASAAPGEVSARAASGVLLPPVVFLAIVLPFLGRAHAIDDPLYLEAARHVLAHPFDPLGGPSFWHERPAALFDDLYNPPLTAYLLAIPMALAGGSEIAVHLLMIFIALLALGATAAVGRRLETPPRLTLLLATSPALALASVSAMTDVPFLLLTALAYGAALGARATQAGTLVGASALTKYSGALSLVPVVLALRSRERWRSMLVAAGVLGAWCVVSLVLYGQVHAKAASRFQLIDGRRQAELLLSFVASLGLVGLPSALGLLRWSRVLVIAAVVAGTAAAASIANRSGSFGIALVAFACFASGVALLVAAVQASLRTRDPFLLAAFWLPVMYTVTLVYFGAARYVLPLLPPLLWLLHRGGAFVPEASRRRCVISTLAGAGLCFALLWGDARYANAWRSAAVQLPNPPRRFENGHWGFQWYAGRRGYAPLLPREALRGGDVVAEAVETHAPGVVPAHRAALADRGRIAVASSSLRVMDPGVHAGLYSSAWGLLPFGFRSGAVEIVRLWTPAPWLMDVAARPAAGPVVLDLGSPEARWTELDGWSGDEGFDDGGVRRTFAWIVGPEAALRVSLRSGLGRVALRVFPTPGAEGPLAIAIGASARATVTVAAGWRTYEAAVDGTVSGGPTTIILRPSGYHKPGVLDRERRELAVAVDGIAFGDGDPAASNHGVWPMPAADGRPGLLVANQRAWLGGAAQSRVRMRIAAGPPAQLLWTSEAGDQQLWSAASCTSEECGVDVVTPPWPGVLVLDAVRALVSDLAIEPAAR